MIIVLISIMIIVLNRYLQIANAAQKHVFRAINLLRRELLHKNHTKISAKIVRFFWNFLQKFFNVGHRHEIIHDDGVH